MAARLPVEIVGRIIAIIYYRNSQTKRNPASLLSLTLVSRAFHAEAERLIYSHLNFTRPDQVVRFFLTIKGKPDLAVFTRSLTVNLVLNLPNGLSLMDHMIWSQDDRRWEKYLGRVTVQFHDLVSQNIAKLVNLQEYVIALGGPHFSRLESVHGAAWLPLNTPFRLKKFTCDFSGSSTVMAFLASQPSIGDIFAPYFMPANGTKFPTSALPNLRTIVCKPVLASFLVPKRPVRRVGLKDTHSLSDMVVPATVSILPNLARASGSVKHFDVAVMRVANAAEVLLEPLNAHLPRLESIVMRRQHAMNWEMTEDVYSLYLSDPFSQRLAAFTKLKQLILPAPSAYTHLRGANLIPPQIATFHDMMNNMQDQVEGINLPPVPGQGVIDIFVTAAGPAPQPTPNADPETDSDMPALLDVGPEDEQVDPASPALAHTISNATPAAPTPAPAPAPAPAAPAPPPFPPFAPFLQQLANTPGVTVNGLHFVTTPAGQVLPAGGPPLPLPAAPIGLQPVPPQTGPAPPPVMMGPPLPPIFNAQPGGNPPPPNLMALLQPMLQGVINNMMNGPLPAPGAPAPAPAPAPGAPALAQPWNVGATIVVHGTMNVVEPPEFGPPPPPQQAQVPDMNPPPALFGPLQPQPQPPAAEPHPQAAGQPPQPPVAATGEQAQDTNNAIMNMIAESQANVNNLQQELMQTQAELAQVQQNLQAIGQAIAPGVFPPGAGVGGPPQPVFPTVGPLPSASEQAQSSLRSSTAARPKLRIMDEKEKDALEKGRRSLKDKELMILEKWKLGGYLPNLRAVSFDMDDMRRTHWTWKPLKSKATGMNDSLTGSDIEDNQEIGEVSGRWEAEYVDRR